MGELPSRERGGGGLFGGVGMPCSLSSCGGCHRLATKWIRSSTIWLKLGRAANSTSTSGEGDSRWIRIGTAFHTPRSSGKKSLGGVRCHLISLFQILPKMLATV